MGNMLLATQRYVVCEDIWNEKMSFNPFLAKPRLDAEVVLKFMRYY